MNARTSRIVRTVLALLTAASAIVALSASPASADEVCTLRMTSLTADNLLDDGGDDHVWVKLDQTFFPDGNTGVRFVGPGAVRSANSFQFPVMGFGTTGLRTWVVVDTFGPNRFVAADDVIACAATTDGAMTYDDGDAIYTMRYVVTKA